MTLQLAMTIAQVKETEQIANKLIAKNEEIYTKESRLAVAMAFQGLRAVFEETYPDPVRVVSIGIPIEDLEADPAHPDGVNTSTEFCGGTYVQRKTKHSIIRFSTTNMINMFEPKTFKRNQFHFKKKPFEF